MTRRHETVLELEVPFHDVDPLGVVWHGHYYKYFEQARTRLLRARGLDGEDLIELGFLFLVAESRCRHANPLRYADRMRVSAWVADTRRRIHIAFEIGNLTRGTRAARGHTLLVTTDLERNLQVETPDAIRAKLA